MHDENHCSRWLHVCCVTEKILIPDNIINQYLLACECDEPETLVV
jgi:hypothetical protein